MKPARIPSARLMPFPAHRKALAAFLGRESGNSTQGQQGPF